MVGKLKYSLLLLVSLLLVHNSYAAKRYWRGNNTNKTWTSTGNWSATSGGTTGASLPGTSDSVYFDGNGTGQCGVNTTVSIKMLSIASGYTDTLKQNAFGFTVGTSGITISGGTFIGCSSGVNTITDQGLFTQTAGVFTSTINRMLIQKDFTLTGGTFNHNNGEVFFTGVFTIKGTATFYDCTFYPLSGTGGTFAIDTTSSLTVNHLLSLSTGAVLNSGKIHAKGDLAQISGATTYSGNTGTIVIDGTGSQTFSGVSTSNLGYICNVDINKSSGTLYVKDNVVMGGTWKHTAGMVDYTTYNSTLVFAYGATNNSIKENLQAINNLALNTTSAGATTTLTINTGDTVTVGGTFTTNGTGITTHSGAIKLKGNYIANNTNTSAVNGGLNGVLIICGTGTQILTGNSTKLAGGLCNVVIDKSPSDTLLLKNTISVNGDWVFKHGIVDGKKYSSTVVFDYLYSVFSKTISGTHALYNVSFYADNTLSVTMPSTDTLKVLGELKLEGDHYLVINTGNICARGDITLANSYVASTSAGAATIIIDGASGDQNFNGYSTVNAGHFLCNIKIKKAVGTLILKNYINVAGNWAYVSGIVDAATNASTVVYYNSTNRKISGKHTLYNVIFYGNAANTDTIASADTLSVAGELKTVGTFAITLAGVINAKGNITVTNTVSAIGGGTGTINICGTGSQTLTGNGISGTGRLCNVKVNKASGTLYLSSYFALGASDWNYVKGTVDAGTSTMVSWGGGNVNCGTTGSSMAFYNFYVQSGTVVLTGLLNVKKDVTIASGKTLTANAYDISIGGNFIGTSATFNYGTGSVTFNGSANQYITAIPTFYTMKVNKPSGKLYPNSAGAIAINNALTLTKGVIGISSTKYINLIDNATASGGSDSSYIAGPLRKTGNDVFTFPLGDTALTAYAYHPLSITAPGVTTDVFTGQYFATGQTYGATLQTDSLETISGCEYWLLTRTTGTSTVIPKVGWNSNSCDVYDVADISVAGWNGSQWNKLGKGTVTYGTASGTVAALRGLSASALPIAIGSPVTKNPTSDAVLRKKLDAGYYTLYNGLLKFKFNEEYVNNGNELEFKIYDKDRNVIISNATAGVNLYVVYKDNRWAMNVKTILPSIAAGYYVLEVKDKKGEVSLLRFKI